MTKVLFTRISRNAKTGPIPVSMSPKNTCPDTCPLKAGGCYAQGGPINLHWMKLSGERVGIAWADFLHAIRSLHRATLWRHNQAGDLPGLGNRIDASELGELVEANKGRNGFTYTHKPVLDGEADKNTVKANRKAIAEANKGGFTVNLSGDSLTDADKLASLAIGPVVTLLPASVTRNTVTPQGRKVVVCPATYMENVSCSTCKLCQRAERSHIIGFPAHGVSTKRASAIAEKL